MIQLRVHVLSTPGDSWLEIDGRKVDGVRVVVASEETDFYSLSLTGETGKGVEIVFEEDESPTS